MVNQAAERRMMASMDYSAKARRRAIQILRPGELKSIDTNLSSSVVSTSEIITCINACESGAEIGQRIGREITMKSIQIRGYFYPNGANTGDTIQYAIVYDRQTNAAAPGWTAVYNTDSVVPNLRNLDNRKRFKVLASGWIMLPAATSLEVKRVPLEIYKKITLPTEYNAVNGGTVSDITSGGLFWMVQGTGVNPNEASFAGYARVRYSDT